MASVPKLAFELKRERKKRTQEMEEDYFANQHYSQNIDCIIPSAELLINFRVNGLRAKKSCIVYAEKMDFKGLIQLRLAEKCDQRRMYITTVDSSTFHELKQDQSLHVTFAGFIENLVRILQDCQAGKLEINVVQLQSQQTAVGRDLSATVAGVAGTNVEYQLQFVEMRPFKNLIHLCLPCRIAPLNVVLFYMNSILDAMQKRTTEEERTAQQRQHELQTHLHRLEQLEAENCKLRENLLETSRNLNQRHTEEIKQLQESLRKAAEQRQSDNERSRKTITGLQAQLEKSAVDKTNLQTEKIYEQKRNETLNEELVNSRTHVATLRKENEKVNVEIAAVKNLERKNEMHLVDARKHIGELQEKLKKYDKAKADIIAELEAEKKILHTKRQALEMATEEISKANEIIMKQSQELIKVKKTIGWRTEVALEQEKEIQHKEGLLKQREQEIQHMRQTIESLRQEIPQQLDSMRKFANSLELKYNAQIKALKEKLKSPAGKENYPPSTLTTTRRK